MPTYDEVDREAHAIDQVREGHLAAVLAEFGTTRLTLDGAVGAPAWRYLLVQSDVSARIGSDRHWWTDHHTVERAWAFHAEEADVEGEWKVLRLVDLDTGEALSTSPPPEPVASSHGAPGGLSMVMDLAVRLLEDGLVWQPSEELRLALIRENDLNPWRRPQVEVEWWKGPSSGEPCAETAVTFGLGDPAGDLLRTLALLNSDDQGDNDA